jgi:hypothetical protein
MCRFAAELGLPEPTDQEIEDLLDLAAPQRGPLSEQRIPFRAGSSAALVPTRRPPASSPSTSPPRSVTDRSAIESHAESADPLTRVGP